MTDIALKKTKKKVDTVKKAAKKTVNKVAKTTVKKLSRKQVPPATSDASSVFNFSILAAGGAAFAKRRRLEDGIMGAFMCSVGKSINTQSIIAKSIADIFNPQKSVSKSNSNSGTLSHPTHPDMYKRQAQKLFDSTPGSSDIPSDLAVAINEALAKYLTRTEYNTNFDIHHVVAKAAERAEPAREVLRSAGIDVWSDPDNLATIRQNLHKHLHKRAYYEAVNEVFKSVKDSSSSVIWNTLKKIKLFLENLSVSLPC